MKQYFTSFFSFSKKELNGILVLFVVVTMILGFPFCYRLFDEPETYDLAQFRKEIAAFKASAVAGNEKYAWLKDKIEESARKPEYFEFDPNIASASEWTKLGLSSRQIKVIRNYLSKGGKFFRKEDLQKIYSISPDQYSGLEPYINIPPRPEKAFSERKLPVVNGSRPPNNGSRPPKEIVIVELNAADSIMLDQLRGIGPAFASRIIRFRNRLGGFYAKEQLKEVYGMDSIRYALVENQVKIDPFSIKRINANTATFEDLKSHPYLSYKQINALIQYRKQHGNYSSPGDLKKVLILNEEIIRKIEPYLSFDP
ncbi:helix-hairpin-helix domain-containing protein [Daejeonella sp.]|uniref:ComEA family DNA-binding protein n=1 Tax=Daejeonella sp. TaxID=2805397 RepID=UPI0030BDD537